MHAEVMGSLEEYLSGALEPAVRREIEAHLLSCELCREEVGSMQETSALFASLRSDEICEPAPGFYAGIMRRVEEHKPAPSFASLFVLDLTFARRLVFASLITLAVLGSYLVSHETGYAQGPSAEAVMAVQNSPAFDASPGQDQMLITLAAYAR